MAVQSYHAPGTGSPRAALLRLAQASEIKFRVNDAKPGFVDYSDSQLFNLLEAELAEMYLALAKLGEHPTPEDCEAALFECADAWNCITMIAHAKGLLGDDLDPRGRLLAS